MEAPSVSSGLQESQGDSSMKVPELHRSMSVQRRPPPACAMPRPEALPFSMLSQPEPVRPPAEVLDPFQSDAEDDLVAAELTAIFLSLNAMPARPASRPS